MKIGQMIRNLKAFSQMVFSRSGIGWLLFPNSKRNYASKVDMLASNVIMAPVLWIARQFTEARLAIDDGEEVIHDHDMLRLIRRPNKFYSGLLLWMATVISMLLDGNAYWIIVRNGQLKPVELWYVPHWLIDPRSESDSEFIQYYRYTPGGKQIKLNPDDVVHFRYGLDPDNIRKGLSPLKPALREVFTDEEAANFTASILVNGGVPGLLISPDSESDITPDDADAVKAYIKKKYTRDNRGEPMVMSGPTKVQEFGFSPDKMNLSAIRNIPEERITALLGIPAAIVGFGTGLEQATQNATMQTLRRVAFESAIIPIQKLVAEELQIQFLADFEPDPDSVETIFDNSSVRVLQEDETNLWRRVNIAVAGGWLSVARAQAIVGEEPDETQDGYLRRSGTTIVPAAEDPFDTSRDGATSGTQDAVQNTALNGAQISSLVNVITTTASGQMSLGTARALIRASFPLLSDEMISQMVNSIVVNPGQSIEETEKMLKALKATDEEARAYLDRLAKDADRLTDSFASELSRRLSEYGERAAEIYQEVAASYGLASAESGQRKDNAPEDEIIITMVIEKLTESLDQAAVLAYGVHYVRVAKATIDGISATLGAAVNLTDQMEGQLIREGGTRMGLVDLAADARAELMDVLAEAREQGYGAEKLAREIRDRVPAGPWKDAKTRARIIARTETKYAQNISSIVAAAGSGAVAVQIIDGRLDTSCDICIARDGMVVSVADAEQIAANEHPNGTMSLIPLYNPEAAERIVPAAQVPQR